MISAILFDKDGTLFDFQVSWSAWAMTFLRDAAGGDEQRAARLGDVLGFDWQAARFREDSCVIAGTDDDIVTALMPEIPGVSRQDMKTRIALAAAEAPMREAVPLAPFLDDLKARGLAGGVATNDTEATARAHLTTAKVLERFDFVTGADSGHGAKPGPGMCLAFAAALGLPPEQVRMVGDSLHDLHAGRAAGMRTIEVCVTSTLTNRRRHVIAPVRGLVWSPLRASSAISV